MRKFFLFLPVFLSAFAPAFAQAKAPQTNTTAKIPSVVPIKEIVATGAFSGRKYSNDRLNFSITLPDAWEIKPNNFADDMLKQGVDIRLKAPDSLRPGDQAKINQSLRRVEILLTASRARFDSYQNAILRVSAEDLKSNPQIKDEIAGGFCLFRHAGREARASRVCISRYRFRSWQETLVCDGAERLCRSLHPLLQL